MVNENKEFLFNKTTTKFCRFFAGFNFADAPFLSFSWGFNFVVRP